MQTIEDFSELSDFKKNTAVAIGNFDGVHLGHQRILEHLVRSAKKDHLISVVLTFSPHPGKFFNKDKFLLIQSPKEKLDLIARFQIEKTVVLPFDKIVSSLSPFQFVKNILINSLRSKLIVVGSNFRFGKGRKGDVKTLQKISQQHNISLHSIPQVTLNGEIVSSSRIRTLLLEGKIEKVNQFLGRPYQITGRVIQGYSRGKHIGFPTANLSPENEIMPQGVFITQSIIGEKTLPSVTNIGQCPTFNKKKTHIESYIINLESEIYGRKMGIQLLKKIRNEKKFDSPEMLKKQITKDIATAKKYFGLDTS